MNREFHKEFLEVFLNHMKSYASGKSENREKVHGKQSTTIPPLAARKTANLYRYVMSCRKATDLNDPDCDALRGMHTDTARREMWGNKRTRQVVCRGIPNEGS